MNVHMPSCLIAVDIQSGFIDEHTAQIPMAIRQFCIHAPIEHRIFTRFINPGEGGPFIEILGWPQLQENREIVLAPEIDDCPTLVVDKYSYSPFIDTKLEDILRRLEVDEVLVFGIDTDVCVLTTAVDLFNRGFHPIVVSDLSMSHAGIEYHNAALSILPRYIGANNIVTTADLHN